MCTCDFIHIIYFTIFLEFLHPKEFLQIFLSNKTSLYYNQMVCSRLYCILKNNKHEEWVT